MPLTKVVFKPGFNKQATATGAEGQWIDGDNVRFRYGQPEKIGGWQQLTDNQLIAGPVRAQHAWVAIDGKRYVALGSSKVLAIYYEGELYDITPLGTAITGCTFDTTDTSAIVTVNKTAHGLSAGEFIKFSSVTPPTGAGYTAETFTDVTYEITGIPTANTFTITMAAAATADNTADGAATVTPYVNIGNPFETYGYGWGTSTWNDSDFGWGDETDADTGVRLAPAQWSLDNFGEILVATVGDGKTYTWDPSAGSRLQVRATVMSGAPTASILTLVSDRDRHLFHFGTETTIGDVTTQDPMFIRFSNQEDYTVYTPTATNTAGTFKLDTGNTIVGAIQGKDYTFVLTDQAAYVLQYVGPPFTFSLKQVGTNCGCIGQHAIVYAQGAIYWMGFGGSFFVYDGTVKQLPCLVEDFVFKTNGGAPGLNFNSGDIIYASHNSLYEEVMWFYPAASASQITRSVVYNYQENVFTTGSLSRSTYIDGDVYEKPYATEYTSTTALPNFPVVQGIGSSGSQIGRSTYYAHETGTDQVNYLGVKTAIQSYIQSGDYDISGQQGLGGDGENIMRVSRFIPDFKDLQGNSKVTMFFRNYPAESGQSDSNGPLITGPFTVNSTTNYISTRVRGRQVSLKIQNDSTDQSWRYGTLRLDVQAGGRR